MDAPQNPAGAFQTEVIPTPARRAELIGEIEAAPAAMRRAVAGVPEARLNVKYRNWTVCQIVQHVADSHANSYVRFKWTLTEDRPTIKAYDEAAWAALGDSHLGDVGPPLVMLEGLHGCWVRLLRCLSDEQWQRSFVHPETGKAVGLSDALCYYAWHGRHHTGQVNWLRQQHGW